jgi:hypothetical protein
MVEDAGGVGMNPRTGWGEMVTYTVKAFGAPRRDNARDRTIGR